MGLELPPSVEQPLLIHGDCLELMRRLPDGCVHLIATDPPYFRVKGDAWDRQWSSAAEFIAWMGELADEWRRVLAPNGSLYVFASPQMAARVEVTIAERLAVLNSIVWEKPGATWAAVYGEERFRSYVDKSERIIFAAHCNPIGAAMAAARLAAGLSRVDVARFMGCDSRLVQKWEEDDADGQHSLIPKAEWTRLFSLLGRLPPYDELVRPFTVSADVPYTDVWTFPTVLNYPGKHPCEKPRAMMDHIVKASSRPGDIVLDCFLGSGVTGESAVASGRRFIGMELGDYIHGARRRIANAIGTPRAAAAVNAVAPDGAQLSLL